ncbi:MAG TPA: hypothetical protein VGR35_08065 [Tepidisphaeraceae bacterium]|nr:hypothetical protein [Tepidisphaeraceae bacterium]
MVFKNVGQYVGVFKELRDRNGEKNGKRWHMRSVVVQSLGGQAEFMVASDFKPAVTEGQNVDVRYELDTGSGGRINLRLRSIAEVKGAAAAVAS